MTNCWKCDVCNRTFLIKEDCIKHEKSHYPYLNYKQIACLEALKDRNREVCDFCAQAYYVYGCELNCEHMKTCIKKGYNKFIPNEKLLKITKKDE